MEQTSTLTTIENDCPICKGPLLDPCQLDTCSHIFCRQCLVQSLRCRDHCPVCRIKVQIDQVLPALEANATSRQRRSPFLQRIGQPLPGLSGFSPNTLRPISAGIRSQIRQLQIACQAPPAAPPIGPRLVRRQPSVSTTPPTQTPASLLTTATIPNLRNLNPLPISDLPAPQNQINSLRPPLIYSNLSLIVPSVAHPDLISIGSSYSSSDDDDDDDDDDNSDLDGLMLEYQIKQMDQHDQSVSSAVGTFVCPYCQEDGLDVLELKDHCNSNHALDNRRVVCPVCVVLPHGNPNQFSRNFIGHLNLRHRYYAEDYLRNQQSDMMNEQAALFDSYSVTTENARRSIGFTN